MRYYILNILYKIYLRYKYSVVLKAGVSVNKNVYFEGKNYIGKKTEFFDSRIGYASYIANNSSIRNAEIGKFCSIGDNVRTKLGMHPATKFVSTHPAFFSYNSAVNVFSCQEQRYKEHKYIDEENKFVIKIGHDVWIGNNVLITDGVTIGTGAIIAAGAVVTQNVEPYTIIGGVPAKKIKTRFSNQEINYLMKLKWWNFDYKKLEKIYPYFDDIEQFMKNIPL